MIRNAVSIIKEIFIEEIELDTSSVRTNYIGCYKDDSARDLDNVVNHDSMTIEFCSRFCLSSADIYFGTQNGLD